MPTSSSPRALTYKLDRPEPKSLDDDNMSMLRDEDEVMARSVKALKNDDDWGSRRGTPTTTGSPYGSPIMGAPLKRERHIAGRMTAMVAPVGGGAAVGGTAAMATRHIDKSDIKVRERQPTPLAPTKPNGSTYNGAKKPLTCLERMRRAGMGFAACFTGCFRWCYMYHFPSLGIGMLIGAIMSGLIVGLVLWAEIKARDEIIAAKPDLTDCFKDPCPGGSSTCGYQGGNTSIMCNCEGNNSTDNLGQAGYIDGYTCTFFNNTLTTAAP